MPTVTVRVEGLSIGYREPILSDISMSLGVGSFAVVGANGSGKSTLIRTLATLLSPLAGRFSIDGCDTRGRRGIRDARRLLGYVPQHSELPAFFTAEDTLRYVAWAHRVSDPEQRIEELVEGFGLRPWRRIRVGELSGGVRQRLSLAAATVHRPLVLLLDEPTVGIDFENRDMLIPLLRGLASETTVVYATHHLDDLMDLGSDFFVVRSSGLGPQQSVDAMGLGSLSMDEAKAALRSAIVGGAGDDAGAG